MLPPPFASCSRWVFFCLNFISSAIYLSSIAATSHVRALNIGGCVLVGTLMDGPGGISCFSFLWCSTLNVGPTPAQSTSYHPSIRHVGTIPNSTPSLKLPCFPLMQNTSLPQKSASSISWPQPLVHSSNTLAKNISDSNIVHQSILLMPFQSFSLYQLILAVSCLFSVVQDHSYFAFMWLWHH